MVVIIHQDVMADLSLFIPCIVDILRPDIGEATVGLFRRIGQNPVYHENQTCCGQPAYNTGFRREARSLAKHFITVFEDDDMIVSPSGSCVYTVKHHYPMLFENDPSWLRRAEAIGSRIFELSQYLVDVLALEDVGSIFHGKVAYHESCHVNRCLGISDQPKALIRKVKGAEFVPLPLADMCCGFGGEFSGKYPEISEALVHAKVQTYLECGADLLVLCEPGCLLNISGYLQRHYPGKKAMHLANFLMLENKTSSS